MSWIAIVDALTRELEAAMRTVGPDSDSSEVHVAAEAMPDRATRYALRSKHNGSRELVTDAGPGCV